MMETVKYKRWTKQKKIIIYIKINNQIIHEHCVIKNRNGLT